MTKANKVSASPLLEKDGKAADVISNVDLEKGADEKGAGEKGADEKGAENAAAGANRSSQKSEAAKKKRRFYVLPLMVFLAVAENIPLLVGIVLAYIFSGLKGSEHVQDFIKNVRVEADFIIESKMDSIMDSTVAKMKSVYEHAYGTTLSGRTVENQIADDTFWEQIKMLSLWTESVAKPFHYPMVKFTFNCNGQIVGTGYDDELETYIAYYTDMVKAQNDAIVCNVYDSSGTTAEKTYRTEFTDKDGWTAIETENFTDHGQLALADGRGDTTYIKATTSDLKCAWSKVFVGLEAPYPLSKTIVASIEDHGDVVGAAAATILLDEVVTIIQEVSLTMPSMSIIILEGTDKKVIAASEGNNAHPVTETCNGEKAVELYKLDEYADVVQEESQNRYKYLLQYMAAHPEFNEKIWAKTADISDEDVNHYYVTHSHFTRTDGDVELLSGIHVTDACGLDYTIYMILDEQTMIKEITIENENANNKIANATRTIWIVIALSCVACSVCGMVLARAISMPLNIIRKDINLVAELNFTNSIARLRPFASELKNMIDEYLKLKLTLCDFNCFVPPHILDELVEQGDDALERTAVSKDIAVLFVYVSNFSAASHNSEADVIADFSNQFIGAAIDHVNNMNGTTIDFFGDSLFGIFNAPYDDPDYIKNAIECANEIVALAARVKGEFMANNPDFSLIEVRVGLHCGSALVGKIGSKSRLKYCAVGDTVNLGSRIENMNRRYNSQMTCSSDFLEALGEQADNYCTRPMEYVKVQGRSEPVLLHEIAGLINSVESSTRQEFKEHSDLFYAVLEKKAGMEEVDAHIEKYGHNAVFLRSAGTDKDQLRELKKQE